MPTILLQAVKVAEEVVERAKQEALKEAEIFLTTWGNKKGDKG